MTLDIEEIRNRLPHRYPFLLIDRVVSVEPGERIQAYKNLTINEPFFNGHFPGKAVFPGVLLVEAMAGSGCSGLCHYGQDASRRIDLLLRGR